MEIFEALIQVEKSSAETGIFELVGIYERCIRGFIKLRLSKQAPKNWYRKYVQANMSPDEIAKVLKVFQEDEIRNCEYIEKSLNPLHYFDCSYYPLIIERIKKANNKLFPDVDETMLTDMKKVPNYRNPASHHRDGFFRDAIPLIIGILVNLNKIENLEKF